MGADKTQVAQKKRDIVLLGKSGSFCQVLSVNNKVCGCFSGRVRTFLGFLR